jgi:hypothetical protein
MVPINLKLDTSVSGHLGSSLGTLEGGRQKTAGLETLIWQGTYKSFITSFSRTRI